MGWATLMENDKGRDKSARESIEPQDIFHRAFYPLTLPLTVGPGSIPVASKRGTRSRPSSFDNFDGIGWFRADRVQHLPVLWIRRSPSANAWTNRDDGNHEIVVVSSRLHWRSNWLERHQGVSGLWPCIWLDRTELSAGSTETHDNSRRRKMQS